MTTRQSIQVDVDEESRVPYLKDAYGNKLVEATSIGIVDGEEKFEFNIYSKWIRRSYTVNLVDDRGVLTSSEIKYKVYKYDEGFGKLYTTKINLTPLMDNYITNSTLGLDHSALIRVSDADIRFKFMKWVDVSTLDSYYQWYQPAIEDLEFNESYVPAEDEEVNHNIYTTPEAYPTGYPTIYIDCEYNHTTSTDTTLIATWQQMYQICYRKKTGIARYDSGVYAIPGEIVRLFSNSEMLSLSGQSTTIVSPPSQYVFRGWVPHSTKVTNIPIDMIDDYYFYQVSEADLINQNLITASNNTFAFYSHFELPPSDE